MSDILARLAATIRARRDADPSSSHTARLLARGPEKCAQKFGEEAVEAIIEAVRGHRTQLVYESADTLYHMIVMLEAREVALDDVLAELARREGTSGIEEKAARRVRVPGGEGEAGEEPEVEISRARTPEALAQCLALRALVFIGEQHVPPSLEHDGLDGVAEHWIARIGGETIGTGRVLLRGGRAQLQRVAIRRDLRGQGIGDQLIRCILDDLASRIEIPEVRLEAHVRAVPYYERLGFTAEGPEFIEAGVARRRMVRHRD